ncbi:MAG: FtsX-like permease family protein [Leptolyngbya sp. SIOISBB]|nr:FtsX-like permease family protein [Leptolyngbya sp. SIOISBB]
MTWWKRTPLALLNLTHDRRKFATSLAGVGFAVLLMFLFTGFQNALYDSQVQLINRLNADIIIINRLKNNMFVPEPFARRRLYQAKALAGVQAAYPMYMSDVRWKNPLTRQTRPVRVLAFNLADPVLPLSGISTHLEALKMPNTALIDTRARAEIGPREPGIQTELAERDIRIVGTFELGTDFAAGNGNLIMSDQNFLRYFANRGPEEDERSFATVDIGLVKVAPDVNVDEMVQQLSDFLPKDVKVMRRSGPGNSFEAQERDYWRESTNIAFVFSLLTIMSFFVGIILVYQILYTDVADHWSEYATLKAMGYSNRFLFNVVIQEALILSVLGFIPGILISRLLYTGASNAIGLVFLMTPARIANIYLATFAMCLISGTIAVRKVQSTDPAEVFG